MTRRHPLSRLALLAAVCLVVTSVPGGCVRRPEPTNLVVIVVDTLRADRLSLYGNSRVTSSNLDAWATSHGVVFERVMAAAPLTLPAHVSIFSGLDAHRHGVNHDGRVPGSIPLLAPLLQQAGYSTAAVTGGGYLHPEFGLDRGFDQFLYWSDDTVEPPATELESNVELALEVLDDLGQDPFFLFFHTYEVHDPYLPRSPFFERFHGDHPPPIVSLDHHREHGPSQGFVDQRRLGILEAGHPGSWSPLPPDLAQLPYDLYDSSIAFTDHHLFRLLQRLQELDDTRPTLVVFTSDHGEMLGEHGLGGHTSLQEEAVRVPLIMALPDGRFAGTRFPSPVRSTDLLPTILEVLGLPPLPGIDGVSLLPALIGSSGSNSRKPVVAWSYASKPNLGLVVRGEGNMSVYFNHTVWEPARSNVRVLRETGLPVEPEDPTDHWAEKARQLVATTVTRLEQETPGLRILMRNTGTEPIGGELHGKAIHPARIKSVDLSCACIEWLGDQRARFEVPSTTSYTLILEQVAGGHLEVLLDHPRDEAFDLALAELAGTQSLVYSDRAWQWLEGEPDTDAPSISFWWSGGLPQPESLVASEVKDQLLRLGYLD